MRESQVNAQASFFEAVLESSPDAVAVLVGGRLAYRNRRATRLLSRRPEAHLPADETDSLIQLLDQADWIRRAGQQQGRVEVQLAEEKVSFDVTVMRVPVDGAPATAVFAREIWPPRPLENRFAPLDRLSALGQLAAGIAHEINNPLAYVLASLELLQAGLTRPEKPSGYPAPTGGMLEAVVNAREGVERVRSIVRDLMAFSRPAAEPNQLVDVEAVLDSMASLAWNEVRHRARLVKRYARVPAVVGDKSRLGQVFLNLIVNAAQALDSGEPENPDDSAITLSTALDGDRVVVEVTDTGAGIGEGDLPHVFEPFFTTNPSGRGTGLGLAICQTIVTSHGGEIDVKSELGQGATFRVRLPVGFPDSAEPGRSADATPQERTGRARIMIIDDEPLLGQTLTFAFSGRHDIALAASGRDALKRLSENADYDLILCDLMMPDVSGLKVFETVERDHPELVPRFVFMTGGAFTDKAQVFLESYRGKRIDKPFTISDVERVLAGLQARRESS